jgi:hypothetical protein
MVSWRMHALEEYDANGYLECNHDGTVMVSNRPETLEETYIHTCMDDDLITEFDRSTSPQDEHLSEFGPT